MTTLSYVMHLAHANWQSDTWSERLHQAWAINAIRQCLQRGLLRFTFIKKDGSIREACGTLCNKLIPEAQRPKGVRAKRIEQGLEQPNYTSIAYYDLDKEEWRSFAVDSLDELRQVFIVNQ